MQCCRCGSPIATRFYLEAGGKLCPSCGQRAQNPTWLERIRSLGKSPPEVEGPWTAGPISSTFPLPAGVTVHFREVRLGNGMSYWEGQFTRSSQVFQVSAQYHDFCSGRLGNLGDSRMQRSQSQSSWFNADVLYTLMRGRAVQWKRQGDQIYGQGRQETTSPHGDYAEACEVTLNLPALSGAYVVKSRLDITQ